MYVRFCDICWDLYDENEGVNTSYLHCIDCRIDRHLEYFSSKQQKKKDPVCRDCIEVRAQKRNQESLEASLKSHGDCYEKIFSCIILWAAKDTLQFLHKSGQTPFWRCRLCGVQSLTYDGIMRHFNGKKHVQNLDRALVFGCKVALPRILEHKIK